MAGPNTFNGVTTYDCYVSGLSIELTHENIKDAFEEAGGVASVLLPKVQKGPLHIAFIRYHSEQDAYKAVQIMNGKVLRGNLIMVKRSEPKKYNKTGAVYSKTDVETFNNKPGVVTNHLPHSGSVTAKFTSTDIRYGVSPTVLKSESVIVTHVEPPLTIYIQCVNHSNDGTVLADNLQTVCSIAQPIEGRPDEKVVYGARFSVDNLWYRCKVSKYVGESESIMTFIDFGNSESKINSEIVMLPKMVQNTKPLSSACTLYGLMPIQGPADFQQKCTDQLFQLTAARQLTAEYLTGGLSNMAPEKLQTIILTRDDGVDINQEMLNDGFAKRCLKQSNAISSENNVVSTNDPIMTDTSHFDSLMKAAHEQLGTSNWINEPVVLDAYPWGSQATEQNNVFGGMPNPPDLNMPPPNMVYNERTNTPDSNMFPANTTSIRYEHDQSRLHSLNAEEIKLRAELESARKHIHLIESQVRAATSEANTLRLELEDTKRQRNQQLDQLQMENRVIMAQLSSQNESTEHLQKACNQLQNQVDENDLSLRMKTLIASVEYIKRVRKQFPSDEHSLDIIERCINVLRKEDECIVIENIQSLNSVKVLQQTYDELQTKIKQHTDFTNVEELIGPRDNARREFYEEIDNFLQHANEIPLTHRAQQLQSLIDQLTNMYGSFLETTTNAESVLPYTDMAHQYINWKSSKMSVFREARTETNTENNAVNSSLRSVLQRLCLNEAYQSEGINMAPHVDDRLTSFQKALNKEISCTDIERIPEDFGIVSSILHSLKQRLKLELGQIALLQTLHHNYCQLKTNISPWLNDKPCITDLQEICKKIKSCKSKLRHKIADLVDLEEDCDCPFEELQLLKKDVSEQRSQLQAAFQKEVNILYKLTEINEKHFPELSLQYPNTVLDSSTHGGLLLPGRNLDQFDLTPLDKSNIQLSSFCGEPILIKEYVLSEATCVNKWEFTKRASSYHDVQSPHLVNVQGIFFSKNDRQMYIQLPHFGNTLANHASLKHLNAISQFSVMRDLLSAITALHSANLVHGAIHPANVMITEDGHALLSEYNFTLSPKQRAEKPFISEHGLQFLAPEVHAGEVSKASDMYNLGMIAYWMHNPKGSNVTDLNKISEDHKLTDPTWEWTKDATQSAYLIKLLSYLLNPEPSRRLNAVEAAAFPYFSEPVCNSSEKISTHDNKDVLEETADQISHTSPVYVGTGPTSILKHNTSPRGTVDVRVTYGNATIFNLDGSGSGEDETYINDTSAPDIIQDTTHADNRVSHQINQTYTPGINDNSEPTGVTSYNETTTETIESNMDTAVSGDNDLTTGSNTESTATDDDCLEFTSSSHCTDVDREVEHTAVSQDCNGMPLNQGRTDNGDFSELTRLNKDGTMLHRSHSPFAIDDDELTALGCNNELTDVNNHIELTDCVLTSMKPTCSNGSDTMVLESLSYDVNHGNIDTTNNSDDCIIKHAAVSFEKSESTTLGENSDCDSASGDSKGFTDVCDEQKYTTLTNGDYENFVEAHVN